MEKVVTKIGDVTIERRISKPKPALDSSIGNQVQQIGSTFSQDMPKTDDLGRLTELVASNIKPEITITNKTTNRTFSVGGNKEFKFVDLHKKPVSSSASGRDFSCNFSSSAMTSYESSGCSESKQRLENESETEEILEMKESGVSLPKVPRVAPVTASVGINEPDLSKFVGISIERKKKLDIEIQPSRSFGEGDSLEVQDVKPSISIQRISPRSESNEGDDKFCEMDQGDGLQRDIISFSDMKRELVEANENQPESSSTTEDHNNEEDIKPEEKKELEQEVNENENAELDNDDQDLPVKEEEEEEEELEDRSEDILKGEEEEDSETKDPDINDFACTDLVELMQKGEIEGEIEDVKEEGDEGGDDSEKKKAEKRKLKENEEDEGETKDDEEGVKDENGEGKAVKSKKKKKTEKKEGEDKKETGEGDGDEEGKDKNIDKSKVTNANLRKNIREVMDETKLDEATLSAQRQEAERLKRLQEQQRIIREVQRQIALNRQNQKSQNKVLSLLQGNSQTSILKASSTGTQAQNSQGKNQNSVLVKLSNGEQTSLNNKKMIELLKNSKNKTILSKPPIPKTLFKQGMVTPSVSIAPIIKKEPVIDDKKKKKGDVVTLSSDSEDDCIVLSDEDESEPEEDPTNSGMHTNDKYNLPDEQGRVLVNVGHPESESDLYLAPQIAKVIKPHQIGGIRFLYDNVIESTERFSSSTGFGCILAHSMGLGKTLQIVSFSDIFLRYTSAKTILCIMPINTIQNWLAEFNMWLPKESTSEEVRCRDFELFIVNESLKNINSRAKVILDWKKSGGVLLMGYELFRLLSLKKSHKSKKKKRDAEEEDAKNKELVEEVYSALVVPGPDLVICDEGHRIKNSHATTSQALKQIRTKRRIVLTGYPLQNNLLEYWCMVDFVRPNYLGSKTEFSNMFERPIQNGQCIDSTPQDKRLMRYRAHVLHSLLEGFVQRRSHAVLQSTLPEKEEYVLLLRFTPFQRKLYDTFMNEVVRTVAVPNPLKAFAVCCKIWNHPDVLYNFLKKKGEEIDLDLEEALPPSLQIPQYPYGQQGGNLDAANQQMAPWPRRGPGSRGGKARQANRKGQNIRGRKPAATIPPNVSTGQENMSEGYGSGQFPVTNEFSQKNFPNQPETNLENFQGRNYNQNQFGYGNEYNSQGNYGGGNYSKSSLDNLEEMSANNFQGKRYFPRGNEAGNQVHGYGSSSQGFDSSRPETAFSQTSSNDSNINASFESNLNSSDSGYNQTDSAKAFDYSQDFNSDFYSPGNFQNPGTNTNYSRDTKPPVFQQNNPYYQNSDYRNTNNFNSYSSGNSMNPSFQNYDRQNTNFQSAGPNSGYQPSMQRPSPTQRVPGGSQVSNFQNQSLGGSFQDSNPAPNSSFQRNFQTPNSAFDSSANRFPGQSNNSSNFQGSSSNFEINRNKGTGYPGQNSQQATTNFQSSNYEQNYWSQSNNWGYGDSSKGSQEYRSATTGNSSFMPQQKFNPSFDEGQEPAKSETKNFGGGSNNGAMYPKINCDYSSPSFEKSAEGNETKTASVEYEETEGNKAKEDDEKKEEVKSTDVVKKEDTSLPYDWATDLFKNYVTGIIENSSKMEVFVHIVTESIKLGDRLLVFSQSLLTLDLIENYLHRQNVPGKEEIWAKSRNYFRLDGSTPGLEREKLINEFNSNPNIHLFLVSTRAGSLGINLVGANRVVVFDASWNPCHDTQAVCRVYRYGQQKPCYVYRLVMDSCLEKKIYDRQVNKQGMADRVVDELNPDAHLSIKEVTNLCWDDQGDTTVKDFSDQKDKYNDEIIKMLLERCSKVLSKEPFQHESLLIDRKEKKLSQAEKRLAKRSYELEKQAANQPKNIYSFFPNSGQRNFVKPIASVRPMQSDLNARMSPHLQNRSKWIPADVWQKQGMSAQEMTLPLDVVIPTSSPEKTSIVLKAGQKVMVLKSPKGIYMQLENGKIIAIRSAFKVGQNSQGGDKDDIKKEGMSSTMKNVGKMGPNIRQGVAKQPFPKPFTKFPEKKVFHMNTNIVGKGKHVMVAKAKPFVLNRKMENVATDVKHKMINPKVGYNDQDDKSDSDEATIVEEKVVNVPERRDSSVEEGSFTDDAVLSSSDEKTEEKSEEGKCGMTDSLETLRKVTEKISDPIKRDTEPEPEIQYQQNSALKNYRQNFTSQMTETPTAAIEEKQAEMTNVGVPGGAVSQQTQQTQVPVVGAVPTNRINSGMGGSLNRGTGVVGTGNNMNIGSSIAGNSMGTTTQITNNRTNASTGTGSTVSVSGVSSGSISDSGKDEKRDSTTASGQSQQQGNDNIQNWLMNQSYPPVDPYGNYFPGYYAYGPGPAPMMPPYEGFYPPNNYPMGRNSSTVPPANPKPQLPDTQKTTSQPTQPIANPIAQNVQTATTPRNPPVVNTPPMYPPYPNPYPYHYNYPSNPNFNSQGFSFPNQSQPSQQTTTATTQNTPNPTISSTQQNQASTYDNSMYSAFHRPEAPFQTPDPNPYPSPYPRPPYPSSGTPGFFPYNPPYPNYPYSHNFNPYMHPTGYGYPMQNHPSGGQGSHSNVGVGSSGSGNGSTTNTS